MNLFLYFALSRPYLLRKTPTNAHTKNHSKKWGDNWRSIAIPIPLAAWKKILFGNFLLFISWTFNVNVKLYKQVYFNWIRFKYKSITYCHSISFFFHSFVLFKDFNLMYSISLERLSLIYIGLINVGTDFNLFVFSSFLRLQWLEAQCNVIYLGWFKMAISY